MAVTATVIEYGGDEDLAIAGLLHDCAEDQGGKGRLRDIEHRFGRRVARIVEACSDSLADTHAGEEKPAWELRKQAYIEHLRSADRDVFQVSLADKGEPRHFVTSATGRREFCQGTWHPCRVEHQATTAPPSAHACSSSASRHHCRSQSARSSRIARTRDPG